MAWQQQAAGAISLLANVLPLVAQFAALFNKPGNGAEQHRQVVDATMETVAPLLPAGAEEPIRTAIDRAIPGIVRAKNYTGEFQHGGQ